MSARDVAGKLRRLLFVVPYVAKHPNGVAVEDLAKKLGVDRDEMLADLELLTQVGPPDGDPGEYLLVSVEDGRVFIDLAHRLTRPLRLTPAEGCSLLLGIRALRGSGIAPFDASMESAERKLLGALGRDAGEAETLATGTVDVARVALIATSVWLPGQRGPWRRRALMATYGAVAGALGYAPIRALRLGTADEPASYVAQLAGWARTGRWATTGGVDYLAAVAGVRAQVQAWVGAGDRLCTPAA